MTTAVVCCHIAHDEIALRVRTTCYHQSLWPALKALNPLKMTTFGKDDTPAVDRDRYRPRRNSSKCRNNIFDCRIHVFHFYKSRSANTTISFAKTTGNF